ncbi:MAG: hypothetical protein AAGD25_17825 [Cyanobacteria bacterium P01_F01_bin.150]
MVASYSSTQAHCSRRLTSTLADVAANVGKGAITHFSLQPSLQQSGNTTGVNPSLQCLKAQISALPEQTFGRQWLTLMEQADPSQVVSAQDQVVSGLHILTGYHNDPIGKAELEAFLLGATGNIASLFHCAGAFRHLLNKDSGNSSVLPIKSITSRLYQAYQRGRTSYFEVGNWHPEQLWDLPVQYVRQWFGIAEH